MEKRGWQYPDQFMKLYMKTLKKPSIDLNSSLKITQFQKTNHSKWIMESGDIVDSKYAIFMVFSGDGCELHKLDIF
jgi:hypothetical protein